MNHAIVWFQNDLRLTDNPALSAACKQNYHILPVYILDTTNPNPEGGASQWWLYESLKTLNKTFNNHLIVLKGDPLTLIPKLIKDNHIHTVFWNTVFQPHHLKRDQTLLHQLEALGVSSEIFNAGLLNKPNEIKNQQGEYFKVFTPYWKAAAKHIYIGPTVKPPKPSLLASKTKGIDLPSPPGWSKKLHRHWTPGEKAAQKQLALFEHNLINNYENSRDFPAHQGTSKLSPYLHFGEISPKQVYQTIVESNASDSNKQKFLAELGWREFSYYLLYHFPTLPLENFNPAFDAFKWDRNKNLLKAWQQGRTGFPLVDAGMRELWATGHMHNRVRMITASFLTKDLLINWREGADWFFDCLVDADLASNSASWQWVAGSGADASPYFRIFNPILQSKKFDANGDYIRHWLPELQDVPDKFIHEPWLWDKQLNYPTPIVDHSSQRKEALAKYEKLKKER